jgi:DNA polymerase-3 subunit beta
MKLSVLQEGFSKALNTASRFTSTRPQLPVLGNILLSSKKNRLLISATNLEISISISIGAQVEKEGEITVPAKIITDIVSNLPPGSLSLQVDKEQVKLLTENFNSSVSGMNSSDFPSVPQTIGKESIPFKKEDFIPSLSQVLFAASIDETRPILTGVLFICQKNNLVLVATDGFRLSQKKVSLKTKKQLKIPNLILPKTALFELSRLSSSEEDLDFCFRKTDNQVVFAINNTILASRVIEGEYPDFKKIIPKDSKVKVSLDKEEFLRAVKLSSVFARDSANVVNIDVNKDMITLSAQSSMAGSQKTKVDARVEGGSLTIAFNYKFLEDFLNAVKNDEVQIEFSNESSPGIFTDPKDPSFLHLIMPVRIQG